jgi:peptidoglycan/xylan/chitin deacetylase (PgdA/CDA1 family)
MLSNLKQIGKKIIVRLLRRQLPISLVNKDYTFPLKCVVLENIAELDGKIPCNINFDDLCPIYYDETGLDFGGNIQNGLSVEIRKLLEDYPQIAITFFVIPNARIYSNSILSRRSHKDKYDISLLCHGDWLNYYKFLSDTYNIEYAMHGYSHSQSENLFFSQYTEFAFKNEKESSQAIVAGKNIFQKSGIDVVGFRQPGWDINSDLSLCRVLKEAGFSYIAGSSNNAGFNAGIQRVSNYFPNIVGGILNFSQNVLLDWSIGKIREEIDKIIGMKGLISIKGHFVDRRMPNSLSAANIGKLRQLLDYLLTIYDEDIRWLTLKQISDQISENSSTILSEFCHE